MTSSRVKSSFRTGLRAGLPFILFALPFSMLFGIVAVEAGLTVAQSMGFSVLVIAGAAQFAAVQLMTESAPFWVVVATALAVNLRMAMYSAALAPYLGGAPLLQRLGLAYMNVDQSFAVSSARFEAYPDMSLAERGSFFAGSATPICVTWYSGCLAGALAGEGLREWITLDFILPLVFLALVSTMLRTWAHWVAAGISVLGALALSGLPLNMGLLLAAIAAMAAGALTEVAQARRR